MEAEERGIVDLHEALKIVDRYLAAGGQAYETGEAALAATLFGFSRSKSEFIEICVHGPTQISCTFEASDPDASWFRKLFKGVFQREMELHSREELLRKVEEFFTTPIQEIKRRLEGG